MKVFWLDESGEIVSFSSEFSKEIFKFLYYVTGDAEEILIAAPSIVKDDIICHQEIHAMAVVSSTVKEGDVANICGAGNGRIGKVSGWKSEGFNVLTPKYLRPKISKALNLVEE